ncbi:hypothetical protein A3D70_02345 [Candidatus Adlerbacteria bacterium RIFCSPHIGHO2_02_FULL_54_18]|uniref:Uncharacterized protein n=2 Tax=Candidatus Adleribacteriota TaxID=1752736 RepID=A0A1F4Y2R9_9BACT|nr:MAG: hypothetical protein A2949_03110 [Candidatus Adlerbacteria bacterium RIFCSPLOWO2_01_FULL_54_21b]OGC88164.1 MAG: hypothetical protein A3D70_02345 [Candidatus Adlerbacteria bacterium RIFCSPHIGHO2_02_FULL_54_18]
MRRISVIAIFAACILTATLPRDAAGQSTEPGLFGGLLCNTQQQAEDVFLRSLKNVGGLQGQLQAINELNAANNGPVCIVVMQMQLEVIMRRIDALAHGGNLYDVVEVTIRAASIPAFPVFAHIVFPVPIVRYSVMGAGYKGAKL